MAKRRTHDTTDEIARLAAALTFADVEGAARRLAEQMTDGDADAADLLTVFAALAHSRDPHLADTLYLKAREWVMPFLTATNEATDLFVRDALRAAAKGER